MVIAPSEAQHFIAGYQYLLAEIYLHSNGNPDVDVLEMLAEARELVNVTPSLLDAAATKLESTGQPVAADVLAAIKTLQLKQWVFLRETTKYAIFVEASGEQAYGVLGLTDHISDIIGGSAATFTAGLFEYQGQYVCDGIFKNYVRLGPHLKSEYNETLRLIKKNGGFHTAIPRFL
ncbi:MAG: hypothetical protein PHI11_12530 [Gallionella sp.]|nr:hypothetical protein [Gallionella sp.]